MNLFPFIFQSGDFYTQDSSGLLKSLLGALIGSATSLFVFYRSSSRDKKKAAKLKTESETNTLKYCSALIESILLFGEKQSTAYKEYANDIKEKPLDFHQYRKIIAEDLNRVLNHMNAEQIFHSYITRFGNSREQVTKFQKLFARLDFLYKLYEMANISAEKYTSHLESKLLRYKELSEEEILNYVAVLSADIKHANADYQKNEFYNTLNQAILTYYKTAPEHIPVEHIQEAFINPLKIELVKKFRPIEEARKIEDNCRKATWLYNDIISKSNMTVDEFTDYHEVMDKTVGELKEMSSEIINEKF